MRVRRPDADDAVPPLLQEESGIGLRRRAGRRFRRAEVGDFRVGCRHFENRVAAGRDVHRLRPLVAAAAERERLVGFDGVVTGPELHLPGPVERGDDPPRRRSRRIVAYEKCIPRRRRRRAIRIGEHDPDAQHAERLPRQRRWQDEDQRPERQGSKQETSHQSGPGAFGSHNGLTESRYGHLSNVPRRGFERLQNPSVLSGYGSQR